MMKFLLFLLLLVNGGLFAWHQGYLSEIFPNQHEPERLAKQLNADQVRLISAETANTAPLLPSDNAATSTLANGAGSASASASASTAPRAQVLACLEFGNFSVAEAKKFEAELAPLALGERQSRRNVQDVNTYVVQIPPLASKEAADKKAGELRSLKVSDFYVNNEPNSPVRWSISLGVFKNRAAAQSQLELLNKQGVHSAVIATRTGNTAKLNFQLRNLEPEVVSKLNALKDKFPEQPGKPCKDARAG
jgi:hypothetical protein